jgi:hypothetical protein
MTKGLERNIEQYSFNRATDKQIDLVIEWGFNKVYGGKGLYERNIYNAQEYKEFWEEHKPEIIQFYKDGQLSETYKIDWNLFK